ncbi:MAG: hypothetical protein ACJ72J_12120, partial [Nitrososphaeraceae archaeon]
IIYHGLQKRMPNCAMKCYYNSLRSEQNRLVVIATAFLKIQPESFEIHYTLLSLLLDDIYEGTCNSKRVISM